MKKKDFFDFLDKQFELLNEIIEQGFNKEA